MEIKLFTISHPPMRASRNTYSSSMPKNPTSTDNTMKGRGPQKDGGSHYYQRNGKLQRELPIQMDMLERSQSVEQLAK